MNDRIELKAEVAFLTDLIDKIRRGVLRVPGFQRAYVWRREDMLDLLNSVQEQYPFGGLLLWQTEDTDYHSRDTLGPLKLPDPAGSQLTLILDGQQRLTTLAGLLTPEEQRVTDFEDPGRWSVIFDPSIKGKGGSIGAFSHVTHIDPQNPMHVPVDVFIDNLRLFQVSKAILETGDPRAEQYVRTLEQVARAFQRCTVPISLFISNNLTAAVETFSRLNKKGRQINADEMVCALTAGKEADAFNLSTAIDHTINSVLHQNFGPIDRSVVLRTTLTLADFNLYRSDWTRLGKVLRDNTNKIKEASQASHEGLLMAVEFFKQIGIQNQRILPYRTQLVAAGAFFGRQQQPTDAQRALLEKWVWSTAFSSWFGGGNAALFRRMVEEIRDGMNDPNTPTITNYDLTTPADPLPSTLDFRSARSRAHIAVMLSLNPRDLNDAPLPLATTLIQRGPAAMGHIFASPPAPFKRRSLANRIPHLGVRTPLPSFFQTRSSAWKASHGLPDSELSDSSSEEQIRTFLHEREQLLIQIEQGFMRQKNIPLPKAQGSAPAPIDTEDSWDFLSAE